MRSSSALAVHRKNTMVVSQSLVAELPLNTSSFSLQMNTLSIFVLKLRAILRAKRMERLCLPFSREMIV